MTRNSLLMIVVAGALALSACGLGLEPASKTLDDTVISLTLGSAGDESRAILPGSCFLYFRAWPNAIGVNGSLYGPYSVSANSRFETADVPGRTYAALDVIYSPTALDKTALLSDADLGSLAESCKGSASACRIANAEIIPNRINVLSVTLVPLVETAGVAVLDPLTYRVVIARSLGATTAFARFLKLDGLPANVPLANLTIKAAASGGSVSLALYRADGSRVGNLAYDSSSNAYSLANPASAAYYLLAQGSAASYTLTVQATPQAPGATVTVGFGDLAPALSGSATNLTSSDTLSVTAPAGYVEYRWSLNGSPLAFADDTNVCTLDLRTATSALVGANVIALRVKNADGEYYSSTFAFAISE